MRYFKTLLTSLIASLSLSYSLQAGDVNVLIIGSTQASHTGNTSTNSAFDPTQVKNQLQSLMTAAGHSNVNVVLENRGDENGGAANGGNLATWFSYPYPADVETTSRWPNLQSQAGTQWDYIVLIPDPFTIERIPGYYTHGVAKIAQEVAKDTRPDADKAKIVLLMTWPNDDRAISSVDHYKEVVYRTGRSGDFMVAPAGLAWQVAGSPRDANYPSANGAYIAAASIYSAIYNQSADASNNLANTAQTTFTNNDNAQHYTGKFNFNNPFMMLGDKRRKIFTSDKGTSTERGYENNTVEAADRCRVDGDPNTYGGKYNSSTPEDDGLGWDMSNPMPIALNIGRQYEHVVNPDYWQMGIAFRYQSNYHTDNDLDIAQMQSGDMSMVSSILSQLPSVRGVPARSLYAWMNQYHPTLQQTGGGEHVNGSVLGSYGTFIYTMYSGRCGVDANAQPPGGSSTDNTGEHLGYQMAWHLGRCEVRAPGLKVMPSDKYALTLSPGSTETMSVQFLYPPRDEVTVNVVVSNSNAAIVSPQTLVFTPSNYNVPQSVTVIGLPGSNSSDAFDVTFNSSSNDEVYNSLYDSWAYTTQRPITESPSRVDLGTSNVSTHKNEAVSIKLNVTGAATNNTTIAGPIHGTIQWSGSNLIYTPSSNYVGPDGIAYFVSLNGVLTTAYVEINVEDSVANATRVSVAATDAAAAEAGTDPGTWTITRTGSTSSSLSVNLAVSGTASEGTDYNSIPASITIPASQASVTITLTPVDDATLNEIGETAELTIDPGTGYTPVAGTAVIVITDDDISPPPSIVLDSPTSDRVGIPTSAGLILETTVTSSGPPATMSWSVVSGPGAVIFESPTSEDTAVTFDGNGEYVIRLTADDSIVQSTMDITVNVGAAAQVGLWYGKVSGAQNWTTPNPQTSLLPDPSVETENGHNTGEGIGSKTTEVLTGRIYDADGVMSFTEDSDEYVRIWVGGVLVHSDNGASTRTNSGTLNVTPGWNDFEVRVGNQWSFSGMVTAPGIGFDPAGGNNYQLLTDPGNGSFLRVDTNNIGPVVNAGIDHVAAVGASINLDATVSDENLPIPTSLTTTWVKVHGPGNANFANPAAVDTTVSCNASGIYIVRLVADDGEIKTFSDSFLTVGSVSVPQISVTASDPNASEVGPNGGSWTISRNGSTSSALEVRFSFGGTASFNTDYTTSEAGVIQIPAGQSSVTINLTPVPDSTMEGIETAILNLTPRAFYSIGNGAATIEISEPDSIELTTPNGGESFFVGVPNNIDWISLSGGNVKIELFKDGTLHSEIATSTPNDGSYSWPIPESLPLGNNYSVRVSLLNGSGTNDTSDTYFSIASDPLATALDAPQLIWSTSGNASWFPQSTTTHDGVDAAQSGAITHSQESVLEATINGPGTLTFWWKVSSETNYDHLRFFINDDIQSLISGNPGWASKTFTLPAGTHVIKWTYSKDSSVSSNADTAWVDQVVFTPDAVSYTVTFNKQGGSGGSDTVTANQNNPMPSAAAPTRSGYNFGGYFTATSGSGSQYYTSTMASASNWDIASDTTLYAYWIATYDTWSGSAPFSGDNNNDGVANGIAWLLGATNPNTNASALLPNMAMAEGGPIYSFTCRHSAYRNGATIKAQVSDDLGISDSWANREAAVPDSSALIGDLQFSVQTNPGNSELIDVQVSIIGAVGPRLFMRLDGAP